MEVVQFKDLEKIWKNISQHVNRPTYKSEQSVSQQILNIFQVGDFYYFIFNTQNAQVEYVDPNVVKVLGYPAEDVSPAFFFSVIHPEDQHWFVNFEHTVVEFFQQLPPDQVLNYKVRYDFRLRKKDGTYVRILQQVVTLLADEKGLVMKTLGVHTDITELKPSGRPVLSFIGMNGAPSYVDVEIKTVFVPNKELISPREKQILTLLIEGKTSKEIATILGNTKQTVDKHRKNMLMKTGAKSSAELVVKAVKEGWI